MSKNKNNIFNIMNYIKVNNTFCHANKGLEIRVLSVYITKITVIKLSILS